MGHERNRLGKKVRLKGTLKKQVREESEAEGDMKEAG